MSTIFNRIFQPVRGVNRSGMALMTGSFTVGSSGAVSATNLDCPGFTVTKESQAGLYTIQLVATDGTTAASACQAVDSSSTATYPWAFQAINATVISAVAAGTPLTTSSAILYAVRTYNGVDGHFAIQFFKTVTSGSDETHVDCNIESGGIVLISFMVKLSSVTP